MGLVNVLIEHWWKKQELSTKTGLPKYLWGKAVSCAAYQLNLTSISASEGKIPAEQYYGFVDYSRLRVFDVGPGITFNPLLRKNSIQEERKFDLWDISRMDTAYEIHRPIVLLFLAMSSLMNRTISTMKEVTYLTLKKILK
ncbi:hypothetical protein JTB14_020806 [Gonioctena quinquepunctata]|nr:hypothetical protein JTB14_020806 [Gonioctena quinquepunctata]